MLIIILTAIFGPHFFTVQDPYDYQKSESERLV
ncbi:MAG: hypothetical protein U5P10_13465 [Spirochaetia bacterium]|nr:hypothetical protein [Spirochaetia bacterium]